MRTIAVALLLLLSVVAFAQVADEAMYSELVGLLSYVGILLLSFLFTLIAAIPYIDEVLGKKEVEPGRGPLSDRRLWFLEAVIGLFLISLTLSPGGRRDFGDAEIVAYTIAAVCALLPFVIFAAMAFISNIYRKNLLRNIFSLILWGVFAGSCALFLNQAGEGFFGSFLGVGAAAGALLIFSAFFEEALKGLGLAEFLRGKRTTPILAMLYGFSVGVGFSMLENWLYFSYGATPYAIGVGGWTQVLFYRSFFTTMAHGFFTAFNALLVCELSKKKERFTIGLAAAFILHLTYNALFLSKVGLIGPFLVLAMAFAFLYISYCEMKKEQTRGKK